MAISPLPSEPHIDTALFDAPARFCYREELMVDPPDPFGLDEFEGELPVRDLLMTLAKPLARYTVYYLFEETSDSLDQLADVVTGWVNASTGVIATRSDRDRTRMLLYHVYLPTLDSLDVLQFDADSRTIAMDNTSPTMESFIEQIRHLDRSASGEDLF